MSGGVGGSGVVDVSSAGDASGGVDAGSTSGVVDLGSAGDLPVLVACAHGTRSESGRAVVRALVQDLRAWRPGLDVREAYVDIQQPAVADAVALAVADAAAPGVAHTAALAVADRGVTDRDVVDPTLTDRPMAVVAPLLLSTGFHMREDIGAAVANRPAVAAAPLGPDPRLVDILVERLTESGATAEDAVILAAAGSSDPAAAPAVHEVLTGLRARWPGPVTVGYAAATHPTVADAVTAARDAGAARVVVAAYLLAPGHFHSALARAGADLVTAPLGPHPALARIVLDRFDAARP